MGELAKNISNPQNPEEFKEWMISCRGYNANSYPNYYDVATKMLKQEFLDSPFWKTLSKELNNINHKYKIKHGAFLLGNSEAPEIYIKSLDSLLNKAFRKNVLNNSAFPNEPDGGWITQKNWFGRINDILRTTIVVKYLDGVTFLIEEIKKIAESTGCQFVSSLEAKEEGYYAAHLGIKLHLEVLNDKDYASQDQLINVEIQITTELQALIKNLLHRFYEENRKIHRTDDYKWQWDYTSDEFNSNYLGHIVHYVEGKIVELRDK